MKTFAIFALVVILALARIIVPQHLARALTFTVYGVPLFLFGAGVVVLAMWAMKTRAGHIKTIAEAREIERRSLVQFHHAGNRIVAWVYGEASGGFQDPTLEAAWRITGGPNPGAVERIYNGMHGRNWRGVELPTSLALPEPTQQPLSVMDVIRNRGCYLVVGARNTGKTTLMRWLASERLRAGWQVLVIDPHNSPGKWPAGCHVVTVGEDEPASYERIQGVLNGVVREMKHRFQQVRAGEIGEEQHPGLVVLVDEYMVLNYHLPAIADIFQQLLIESRKVSIDVVIGSHSRRVRSLGLDGKGDLIEGLVIVHLLLHRTGQREALIEDQSGETPAVLPGEFRVADGNGSGWRIDRPLPIELGTPEPDGNEADARRILAVPGWADAWLVGGILTGAWQAEIGRQLGIPNAGSYRRRILAVGVMIETLSTTMGGGRNGR